MSSSLGPTIAPFLVVTAAVAFYAWYRTHHVDNKDARTFFVANRGLPWIQVAGSLLLTNISTEQLVGLNGAAAVHGASVMAWEVMSVFGLIALAWYFLPRYWARDIATIPEFIEQRFDRVTRRIMSTILIIALACVALPFVVFSGGVAMSSIFQIPERLGISPQTAFWGTTCTIGILGALYVSLGGMRAVALAGTVYGAGLLVGALTIPLLALHRLGEGSLSRGFDSLLQVDAAHLNPIGAPASNIPFSTLFSGLLLVSIYYWCSNQSIVQRSFGARSFAEAQKGILATAALKLLGPFYLVFPGIVAARIFLGQVGNGDFAYSKLVAYALPESLTGLFAAILLGCVLSAFNGGLHSASTMLGIDLYRSWLRPGATERQTVRFGKVSAIAICALVVVLSGLLGNAPDGVFTLIKRIMAAFNMPLLTVVALGMINPRVPAWAAKLSLLVGPFLYLALYWTIGQGALGLRIHWLHLAALNALVLSTFMLLAARGQQPATAIANPPGAVAIVPWTHARLATALVIAASFIVYGLFWFFSQPR